MSLYTPLDPAKKELRLLEVWSRSDCRQQGDATTLVHCSISTASLLDHPSYEALSYTWGDASLTTPIVINGHLIQVTVNLESALRHLQCDADSFSLSLWVDAVCIYQDDPDEKGWQVGQMEDVYRRADRVIVWLGEAADDSDAAMRSIRFIGHAASSLIEKQVDELELIAESCLQSQSVPLRELEESSPEHLYRRLMGEAGTEWQYPLPAMTALIRRPWWRRVWILQELVLARELLFVCGDERVEETDFMGAWAALDIVHRIISNRIFDKLETASEYERAFTSAMVDDAAKKMLTYRRRMSMSYKGGTPCQLLSLLRLTLMGRTGRIGSNFDATDARDRIFGLLGLSSDREDLRITPNYRSPCSTVYITATIALLTQGHLSTLELSQSPKRIPNLPSWVPDWSCPLTDPLQIYEDSWYIAAKPCFKAAGDTKPSMNFLHSDVTGAILCISGTRVDTIKSVGPTWQEHWPDETDGSSILEQGMEWLEKLFDLCKKTSWKARILGGSLGGHPYGNEEEWRAAMLQVSTAGQIVDAETNMPRRMTSTDAAALTEAIRALTPPGEDARVWDFLTNISERAYNRRPFLTHRGFLGLGPGQATKGDQLVVLQGGGTPHIIRQTGKSGFQFLGEAYVEGLMDGEALHGAPLLETFQLA